MTSFDWQELNYYLSDEQLMTIQAILQNKKDFEASSLEDLKRDLVNHHVENELDFSPISAINKFDTQGNLVGTYPDEVVKAINFGCEEMICDAKGVVEGERRGWRELRSELRASKF